MKRLTVLGSTGSVGANTLDVIAQHPDRYEVFALTARQDVDGLYAQCERFKPRFVALSESAAAEKLRKKIDSAGLATQVLAESAAIEELAAHADADIVMSAIVGAAGLLPTLAAVRAGKKTLLANKEPLVMCGDLLIAEAVRSKALLLPIDSEHNAVFQCMPGGYVTGESALGVKNIHLTCSGGPFLTHTTEQMRRVTPEQACAHPKWAMGRKISVDSATLMNKGLELIEACRLFKLSPEQVDIVIHPQSVIHSMVEYVDGSMLAQLSNPDMRVPIAHALAWPDRIESGVGALDLVDIARMDFMQPDEARFPCLRLAGDAIKAGGTAPVALNAANEVSVQAFLNGTIAFTDIPYIIEHVLLAHSVKPVMDIETVLQEDRAARAEALRVIAGLEAKQTGVR